MNSNHEPSEWRGSMTLALVCLCFGQTMVCSSAAAQSAMRSNTSTESMVWQYIRLREYDEAVRRGQQSLRSSLRWSSERAKCQTMAGVTFAQWAQGKNANAAVAIKSFDRECRATSIADVYAKHLDTVRVALASRAAPQTRTGPLANRVSTEPYALPPSTSDDGFLPRVAPGSTGLDTVVLLQHRDLCSRSAADACLVVHKGRIVQEWYGPYYKEPMYAMSATKSITGLLVGMLIADGKLSSIDERVCSFLADWCAGARGRVTIRHLMSMTSGLPTLPAAKSVGFSRDKNSSVRALTPTFEPGSTWAYSNEGVQLLSPILDKVAGEPIHRYARRRLFDALGLRHTRLMVDDKLHAWTYADMITTPRELARIGAMVAQGGVWRGRRIVDEQWIKKSVLPSQALNPEYGLLWWTAMPEEQRFAALGYLNTDIQVVPDHNLVVVRMQRVPRNGDPYRSDVYMLLSKLVGRKE